MQAVVKDPAFEQFEDRRRPDSPSITCWLGTWTRPEFLPRTVQDVWTGPDAHEEYYEWVDLMQSALDAGDTYTFIELGAGYGRWGSRAAAAAKALGKTPRLVLAEAEPQHVVWLHQHMADNNIAPKNYRLVEAAIGGGSAPVPFTVGLSPEFGKDGDKDNARDWYGQAIGWTPPSEAVTGSYFGRPTYDMAGWSVIIVPAMTLSDILTDYDLVDLIDFDTQGSEADVIDEALPLLNARVRRLHIGTHAHELEDRIHATLSGAGWRCLRRFDCLQENDTPQGRISFVDGLQSWVNPSLF